MSNRIAQSLLGEFDHEMPSTRKALERVPDAKFSWKPHAKSMSMGDLAAHIAMMVGWAIDTATKDSFDVAPGGKTIDLPRLNTTADVLRVFDQNVPAARAALASITDEAMLKPWSLLHNGSPIFTMPRIATLRSFIFNHIIHHRGQLTVYLRLNELPVPALYGPSADEK